MFFLFYFLFRIAVLRIYFFKVCKGPFTYFLLVTKQIFKDNKKWYNKHKISRKTGIYKYSS